MFALEPVNPYTNEDLNWTVDGSRVNLEHEDESLRDIELVADTVENWDSYDTVFIGYPNLKPGDYTITELSEDRYVPQDSQTVTVYAGQVATVEFSNILKKFTVELTKSDSEKGEAQGDATLAGAKYGLYNGEDLVDTYTTDENGSFTTAEYICGPDWTIREIEPSPGYLLDETVHEVGADAGNFTIEHNTIPVGVGEDVIKGDIAIIKHTDDGSTQIETPEEGAEFQIYLKSAGSYDAADPDERDILTCDADGFAQSKKLPYGEYVVEQTKGWDGTEYMPAFTVTINEHGKTYTQEDPHINEKLVGKAFSPIRDKVVIATKFGLRFDYEDGKVPVPLIADSRPEVIRQSVEGSLKRLETDHIDLYFQHRIDPKVEPEAVAQVMKDLMQEGKIVHWGISEANEDYLRRANAVCPVAAVQNRYSMMVRHYERLFPVLEALGVGLVAFSPMANGFLTGQYGRGAYFDPKTDYRAAMPQFTDEAVKQNAGLLRLLYDMAAEKDATPAQISLAWMLCKHPWIVPIPGTRKEERMKENAGAADVKLSLREVQALDDALAQMNISAVFGGTPVA